MDRKHWPFFPVFFCSGGEQSADRVLAPFSCFLFLRAIDSTIDGKRRPFFLVFSLFCLGGEQSADRPHVGPPFLFPFSFFASDRPLMTSGGLSFLSSPFFIPEKSSRPIDRIFAPLSCFLFFASHQSNHGSQAVAFLSSLLPFLFGRTAVGRLTASWFPFPVSLFFFCERWIQWWIASGDLPFLSSPFFVWEESSRLMDLEERSWLS